jgi:DHA2 family multidrug resistance protein
MFCLLPPTRLALGRLSHAQVPDASGLFNLMRNLGGAIGIALIDTVIYSRASQHGEALIARLKAGDVEAAKFIGLPLKLFAARPAGPLDVASEILLQPMINKGALTLAIDDAWIMLALITLVALICVPFARSVPPVVNAWRE